MGSLHVRLFGGVQVSLPGITAPLNMQRANQLLFAYLLLQPRHHFSREHLIGTFWSEKSETHARQCLRSTLWRLRHLLEPDASQRGSYLVTTPSGDIGFNWCCNYWIDAEEFSRSVEPLLQSPVDAISAEEITVAERALDLYVGDLLEEFYEDWALRKREQLREVYLTTLAQLMHYHAQQENFDNSLVYGRQILEIDPLREQTHRGIMRIYAASGQRPLAIRQYEECRQILQRELGMPPMPETETLYRQITAVTGRHRGPRPPDPDPETCQLALAELRKARQQMDAARAQLHSASDLVRSLLVDRDDLEAE